MEMESERLLFLLMDIRGVEKSLFCVRFLCDFFSCAKYKNKRDDRLFYDFFSSIKKNARQQMQNYMIFFMVQMKKASPTLFFTPRNIMNG
jgi:hypothetical protein